MGIGYDVTVWWPEDGLAPYGENWDIHVLAEWRTRDLGRIELLCLAGLGIQLNASGYPTRFAFEQDLLLPLLSAERITELDPELVVGRPLSVYHHGVILHQDRIAAVPEGRLLYIDAWDGS